MSDPLNALKELVESPEFLAVREATESLDDLLMIQTGIGAHLRAFRFGMQRLADSPLLQTPNEFEDGLIPMPDPTPDPSPDQSGEEPEDEELP